MVKNRILNYNVMYDIKKKLIEHIDGVSLSMNYIKQKPRLCILISRQKVTIQTLVSTFGYPLICSVNDIVSLNRL